MHSTDPLFCALWNFLAFSRKRSASADRRDVSVFRRALVRFSRREFQGEFLAAKIASKPAEGEGGKSQAKSIAAEKFFGVVVFAAFRAGKDFGQTKLAEAA